MRKILLITILLLLIIITACQQNTTPQACINENCFNLEVVDTPQTREKGLMYRQYLPEDKGMLFVFEKTGNYPFWMKNTLIPLDMLWINENKEIVRIMSATPCQEDPCKIYNPKSEALYVLEINANITKEKNIKEGDKVEIKNLK